MAKARHLLFSEAYAGALILDLAGVSHADRDDGDDHDHDHGHVNAHYHVNGHDDDHDFGLDDRHLCRNLGTNYNLQYVTLVLRRPCLRHGDDDFLVASQLHLQTLRQRHDIYITSNSYDCCLQ